MLLLIFLKLTAGEIVGPLIFSGVFGGIMFMFFGGSSSNDTSGGGQRMPSHRASTPPKKHYTHKECPSCHKSFPMSAKFCPDCGEKLKSKE